VSAAEGDAEFPAGVSQAGKYAVHQVGVGFRFGKQYGREEPPGRRAHGGDVVGVDIDGVPADFLGGEGDGVGFRNECAGTE